MEKRKPGHYTLLPQEKKERIRTSGASVVSGDDKERLDP
jgi:hypothetical protein